MFFVLCVTAAVGSLIGVFMLKLDSQLRGESFSWTDLLVIGLISFVFTVGLAGLLCRLSPGFCF